jgi:hypothetical protein
MPPRLEMVKVPPDMSAGDSLPSRAFLETSPSSLLSSVMPLAPTSRITGTTRPPGVSTAIPMWWYRFRIRLSFSGDSELLTSGNWRSAETAAFIRKASRVTR